jgi:hypothetical protein
VRLRWLFTLLLTFDGEEIPLDTQLKIALPHTGEISEHQYLIIAFDQIDVGTSRPIEEPRDAGEFEIAECTLELTPNIVKGIPQI